MVYKSKLYTLEIFLFFRKKLEISIAPDSTISREIFHLYFLINKNFP